MLVLFVVGIAGCTGVLAFQNVTHTRTSGSFDACATAVIDLKASVIAHEADQQDIADLPVEETSLMTCGGPATWKLAADNIDLPRCILSGSGLTGTGAALTAICTEADPQNSTATCANR